MEKIYQCLNAYETKIKVNNQSELETKETLKCNILLTKNLLFDLRKLTRKKVFEKQQDEIYFFKKIKPKVCGKLKFYKLQLEYLIEMPFVSVNKQKAYIQNKVTQLEVKKEKFSSFYSYIKRNEEVYDDKYFIRNTQNPELYLHSDIADFDPEFSTSHDHLASEVEFYNLTIEFFREELQRIENTPSGFGDKKNMETNPQKFNWSASKTDLVELIYALKVSGAINGGDAQIKELTAAFGELFNVDLGNYYKTFTDIKNRTQEPAKFLNKLAMVIANKIEMEDAL